MKLFSMNSLLCFYLTFSSIRLETSTAQSAKQHFFLKKMTSIINLFRRADAKYLLARKSSKEEKDPQESV
jgi:hypothetical protein